MRHFPLIRAIVLGGALVHAAGVAAQKPDEVSFGLASTSVAASAGRVAHQMGLFEKHGIEPKFTVMDNANATMAALVSRSVKAVVAGPGELVVAQGRGQKVVALATAYDGMAGTLVLSKAAAGKVGIAADAPVAERLKALDGLVIGVPSPTAVYTIAYSNAAKSVGAAVRFTYMSQAAMPAAFDSGAIHGYVGSAPFWGIPILKGNGVLWISGPKRELPAQFAPSHTASLQVLRDFAETNPDLVKRLAAVFTDFSKAIAERPAEVKAAVGRLYPDLTPDALELLFASESEGWKTRPLTREDIMREIEFVRASGAPLPEIDKIDPRSLIYP